MACGLALLLGAGRAHPTTVIAPTFEELVDRASTVFVGEVVSRRSQRIDTPEGPLIVTLVTFSVDETLKGASSLQTTLEFLGGTVGDETLVVGGMPQFNVGDRDVVFVGSTANAVSPLIGFSHGRFRVTRDAVSGRDSVRTFDGRAFASTAALGSTERPFPLRDAMTLATFRNAILQRVRASAARRAP